MTRRWSPYAFVAVPLTILFVFTLLPTIAGLALSLFDWNGGGSATFVGVRNFEALANDDRFTPAFRNTLIFVVATVPPTVAIAFFLATALHARWFVGKAIVRTLLFMPTIVSIVAIGLVWRWVLDPDGGPVTRLARAVGWSDPPNWLQDGWWPLVAIIIASIWRQIGFCLVLYLAALSSISPSLYEAATIDGASRRQTIRHITLPQVAPMTAFLLITGVIGALQVFDIVFAMCGQTAETDYTSVLNLYVYRQFIYGQYGYAAAIGVVIFTLTMVATGAQLWWQHRRAGAGGALEAAA